MSVVLKALAKKLLNISAQSNSDTAVLSLLYTWVGIAGFLLMQEISASTNNFSATFVYFRVRYSKMLPICVSKVSHLGACKELD